MGTGGAVTALRTVEQDRPEPAASLLARLAGELPIDAFCELVATMFSVGPGSGEQTVEMNFSDGVFRWARVHSGRIGRDQLEQRRGAQAAHPANEG